MMGTENAVRAAKKNPDWVHCVQQAYTNKQMKVIEMMADETALDLIEIGGETGPGAACDSSIYEQFCMPYDRQQVEALHKIGYTVVYSSDISCLHAIANNGTDGIETTAATSSDDVCDLQNSRLFLIGGFDQCRGFENGTPESVRQMVLDLHNQFPDGGYICAPCNSFFSGDPANIQAFADALRECTY